MKGRYADLKQASADRCPRLLGTFVKAPEVQYPPRRLQPVPLESVLERCSSADRNARAAGPGVFVPVRIGIVLLGEAASTPRLDVRTLRTSNKTRLSIREVSDIPCWPSARMLSPMSSPLLPDALWNLIQPFLPAPTASDPKVADHACQTVLV